MENEEARKKSRLNSEIKSNRRVNHNSSKENALCNHWVTMMLQLHV